MKIELRNGFKEFRTIIKKLYISVHIAVKNLYNYTV